MVSQNLWDLVGVDASKTSTNGNRYLLTQTDYPSKYVEAISLPDKSALNVAKGLYKTYCGMERQLTSWRLCESDGFNFKTIVCECVQRRITSAYHSQSNG